MTKRRYTQREKVAVVTAAAASSVLAAAEESGVPESTVRYWLDKPEFAEIRDKTREELGAEFKVVAHKALARLIDLIPTMEPRDLSILAGLAVDKSQLLSGEATSRSEHRDITDTFDDEERAKLRDAIDRILQAEVA